MEAADRTAGDRDEDEREELPGEDRPRAVDEARHRRHLERRQDDDDAERQGGDDPDLDEGAQVVARREQQPDREYGGDEAVGDHHQGDRWPVKGEDRGEGRVLGDPAAGVQRHHEQQETHRAGLEHPVRAQPAQVDAHQECDRDREAEGNDSPGARLERVHHDEGQHRDEDHHDADHRHQRGVAGDGADLLLGHLAERLAVAAERRAENDAVLHRAAERDADDDPERAREVAELRRERWPHEGPGARDRREVVAEDDPPVCWHEVAAVVEPHRRSRPRRVEGKDVGRDELAVEAIRDRVDAEGGDEEPGGADLLPPREGDGGKAAGAGEGDGGPGQGRTEAGHAERFFSRWRRGECPPRAGPGQRISFLACESR